MNARTVSTVFALGLVGSAAEAGASEHELYFAQAGAMLNYAEAEVRVLYAAVTQRVFDPTVTKQALDELERILTLAKRQAGRASTLLPEPLEKHQEAMGELKDAIIAAERQLEKSREIIEGAIEALTAEESEVEDEEEEGTPQTDWAAIRTSAAWLAQDIKGARTTYAGIARRLPAKALRFPPPPRQKRVE